VLNLTSPLAHTAVNLQVLEAGKHVYTEKPFAMTREDADRVLAFAEDRDLRVGCAPDTVLGGGIQTCRKLLDEGRIGTPYMANGLILMGNAYRSTHPQFQTFLQLGWDPLYDMAPYYLTALITLLGPARRVSGSTGQVRSEVTVTDPESPRYGQTFPVGAPMHAAATIDFANGTIAGLQVAKESFGYTPRLEIYGTDGILYLPDPNIFGGPIQILQPDGTLVDIPWSYGYTENSRGLGVADMAAAIRAGTPHRASGELARHVIDITLGVFESSRTERHVAMTTSVERPEPMPPS
jgi:predicted dehydrogenase